MHQAYDRCKKVNRCNFNRNWPHQRIEIGRLRIQFQRFGANFADRWPRWTGARLIKVRLHSKSFGGPKMAA